MLSKPLGLWAQFKFLGLESSIFSNQSLIRAVVMLVSEAATLPAEIRR